MSEVTRILGDIEHGEQHAAEQLLPLVYEELRRLALEKMAHEKPGQTLQATALVHEAYLEKKETHCIVHRTGPADAQLLWLQELKPHEHLACRYATPGPAGSPCERIIGEYRIVEDHGLGLAPQQAHREDVPEKLRVSGETLILPQPIEPAECLLAMSHAVVSHRQECVISGSAPALRKPLLQSRIASSYRPARWGVPTRAIWSNDRCSGSPPRPRRRGIRDRGEDRARGQM